MGDSKTAGTQSTPASVDISHALHSVVSVRSSIAEDALTAPVLGTERVGHGAVISDDGLILTMGYLIVEAESVWLVDQHENMIPAHVVAYDQESGFGLVQALQRIDAPAIPLGHSSQLDVTSQVVLAGCGDASQIVQTRVIGKQEFAGYWEYVLDEAIFTSPPHPNWGGTALIGPDGKLYGIGSLALHTMSRDQEVEAANMVVPIDLLPPILDDLRGYGRRSTPSRPWLGWFVEEAYNVLIVSGVYKDGPAFEAGIEPGDIVLAVDGAAVDSLAELFRRVWAIGEAGVEVSVELRRVEETRHVSVRSVDRYTAFKPARLH
ncbi:MAG: S1C family serine protease [Gammaproteobacteria bacterium]